jgi:uncharacterized surface protein with fasciclin (FAS1) repeats
MLKRIQLVLPLLLVALLLAVSAVPVAAGPKGPTIVDVAIAINSEGPFAGQFDTLIAAVLAADEAVLETLTGNGQHTVFAPTDAAFEDLGLTPDNIGTALPKDVLTQILLYHVAPGRRYAADVLDSSRIRTLYKGKMGFLSQSGGVLTDNLGRDANIIVTDVPAANGVIHAIDAVVLPYDPLP